MHNYDSFKLSSPEETEFCPYCQEAEIRSLSIDLAMDMAKDYNMQNPASVEEEKTYDDFFDQIFEEYMNESKLCRNCYMEEFDYGDF